MPAEIADYSFLKHGRDHYAERRQARYHPETEPVLHRHGVCRDSPHGDPESSDQGLLEEVLQPWRLPVLLCSTKHTDRHLGELFEFIRKPSLWGLGCDSLRKQGAVL